MFCTNCGKEFADDVLVCPYCGQDHTKKVKTIKNKYATFARLALIFSIVSILTCFLFVYSVPFVFGILSIVFANIAMKDETFEDKATYSLVFALLGMVLSVSLLALLIII